MSAEDVHCAKCETGERSLGLVERVAEPGHVVCVKAALKRGFNLNQADSQGNTALMIAAKKGYTKYIDI